MLLGLAVLLVLSYIPALTRAGIARLAGMRVPRVMIGVGPKLAAWTIGKTRWQLHLIPFAAFSQVAGLHATDSPLAAGATDAFYGRPRLAQFLVLVAGVIGLFVFAAVAGIVGNLAFGIVEFDSSRVVVDTVLPGRPAAAAGLMNDDEIIAVGGAPVGRLEALAPALNATHGPVRLTIRREGVERTVVVVPEDFGGGRRIGVTLMGGDVVRHVGTVRAIVDGALYPVRYARFAVSEEAKQIFAPHPPATLGGPIGIVRVVGRSQSRGPRMVIGMLVVLAVQFALWLIVPVPPTDGYRVLGWLFLRREKPLVGAVDAGVLARTKPPANSAWIVLLVLVAIGGIATAGGGLVVLIGLLRRRAWAWGVTRTASAYLAGSALATSVIRHDAIELAGFALFVVIAWLSRTESVRLFLGLRCPVCNAIKGEPVLGVQHALSCRACGSTWSVKGS